MLAQNAEHRQQRQTEDGEEVAGHPLEQLRAEVLEPVGADRVQRVLAGLVEIMLEEVVAEGTHAQLGAVGGVPDPGVVAHEHGAGDEAVALAAQELQLLARILAGGGLVEPGAVALQHLVAAQHQPAAGAGRDALGLHLGQDLGDLGGRRAVLAKARFHFRFVDRGDGGLDRNAGVAQHLRTRRTAGGEDEGEYVRHRLLLLRHGRTWSDHPRVSMGSAEWQRPNSWMVVPSTTMTRGENVQADEWAPGQARGDGGVGGTSVRHTGGSEDEGRKVAHARTLLRHGRTCSDHPRVSIGDAALLQANSWMVVPSTTMTKRE